MKKNKRNKNRRRSSYGHVLKAKGVQTDATAMSTGGMSHRELVRRITRDTANGRPWPCAHRQCDAEAITVVEVPGGLLAVCDSHRSEAIESSTAMRNRRPAKADELAHQDQRLAQLVQNCDGQGVVSGAAGEGVQCDWPDCGQQAIRKVWVIADRNVQFDAGGCAKHHQQMLENVTAPPNENPVDCAKDLEIGFNALGWEEIDPINDMVLNNGGVVLMPCPHCEWSGKSHVLKVKRTGTDYRVEVA